MLFYPENVSFLEFIVKKLNFENSWMFLSPLFSFSSKYFILYPRLISALIFFSLKKSSKFLRYDPSGVFGLLSIFNGINLGKSFVTVGFYFDKTVRCVAMEFLLLGLIKFCFFYFWWELIFNLENCNEVCVYTLADLYFLTLLKPNFGSKRLICGSSSS